MCKWTRILVHNTILRQFAKCNLKISLALSILKIFEQNFQKVEKNSEQLSIKYNHVTLQKSSINVTEYLKPKFWNYVTGTHAREWTNANILSALLLILNGESMW